MENYVENTCKDDLMDIWLESFIRRMQDETDSYEKEEYTFKDALEAKEFHTDRDKYLIQVCNYLKSNKLFTNEFKKYLFNYNETGNCQIPLNQ